MVPINRILLLYHTLLDFASPYFLARLLWRGDQRNGSGSAIVAQPRTHSKTAEKLGLWISCLSAWFVFEFELDDAPLSSSKGGPPERSWIGGWQQRNSLVPTLLDAITRWKKSVDNKKKLWYNMENTIPIYKNQQISQQYDRLSNFDYTCQ